MTVTHAPKGYTGTVDQLDETRRFGLSTAPFRVASSTDWLVTADVGSTRQVLIAPGEAATWGVSDTTTVQDSLTFAPNTGSLNRYDAVVCTWDWALGPAGQKFQVIPGTSTTPPVNTTSSVDTTKINRVRKTRYDALLAIVRIRPGVGALTSGDVADTRMWGGYEGYANCGSGSFLTLLDTFPGSLVHDITTDIVWNRLPGGVWGFEKWTGTDKTKQPMISGRSTGVSVANGVTTVCPLPSLVDHSQGLISGNPGGGFVCNTYGRVRVVGHAYSDSTHLGGSFFQLTYPAGGGDFLSTLSDERHRGPGGYGGSGSIRQTISPGPMAVAPGDVFTLSLFQLNQDAVAVTYDFYLSLTYV